VNWRNRRTVLILIGAVCALVFAGGIAAAYLNRHNTICSDGKDPVAQRGALLGQVAYQCQNGQIVTMNN
jgi:hypothetical protein